MELNDKISAVITGAGSGLGEATARAMAAKGVKVTIFDLNKEQGQKVADDINCHFEEVDISNADALTIAFEGARKAQGQERLMISCAGICPASKTVSRGEPHDPQLYAKTIQINLIGTFLCASQSAAGMANLNPLETGERGVIINTASIAGYEGQVGQIAYASSKAGVIGMTLPMARDLANIGIRACAIAPGIFKTPMVSGFPQEVQDELASRVPFPHRLGEPNEFAGLAIHIAENSMLNGEVFRIDGAFRMPPK